MELVILKALYGLSQLVQLLEFIWLVACTLGATAYLGPNKINDENQWPDPKMVSNRMCILCYVDNILYIHHRENNVLQRFHTYFPLSQGISDPDMYPGAKVRLLNKENGIQAWEMNPTKYAKV